MKKIIAMCAAGLICTCGLYGCAGGTGVDDNIENGDGIIGYGDGVMDYDGGDGYMAPGGITDGGTDNVNMPY